MVSLPAAFVVTFSKRHVRQSPICQLVSTKGWFLVLFVISQCFVFYYFWSCLFKKKHLFWQIKFSEHTYQEETLFMEEQYRGVYDLGWNYSTAVISAFAKHVGYYWLLLHNYRIGILSLYLSAVPLIQIMMCTRKKQKHVSKFRWILCISKSWVILRSWNVLYRRTSFHNQLKLLYNSSWQFFQPLRTLHKGTVMRR